MAGLSEYMMGTKLIFIDPHGEYKELCDELNGDWINAAGGSKGKINPLQIRAVPRDAENEEEFNSYVGKCKELALYDTGVTAEYGDRLITLSTCEYSARNGRLVVVAKMVG
jgi:hypothetical protein